MRTKAVRYVAWTLASFALFKAGTAFAIDQFRTPALSAVRIEWRTALDQFRAEIGAAPAASDFTFATQRHLRPLGPRSMPAFVQLNAATSAIFPGIGRSPVPVLLPFDVSGWLEAGGSRMPAGMPRYQADFRSVDFFDAGPSGYDAVFSLEPGAGDGLPQRTFARPIEVQITGSQLIYDIADLAGGKGEPVKALSTQYPDLRRFIREGYVRYAFSRFGVPYVVSIQCLDSVPRPRRLACREAYPVAERFLRALRIAGGQPSQPRSNILPGFAERPPNYAADFTYRPVGDILARSGPRGQTGNADLTSYSQIRFPLDAPAFIHSQSFGRRQSSDSSDRPAGLYPWRDNFCEARSFNVGQCAGGHGHQGEDLRAGACPATGEASNPCDPKQQPVFAVRDGVLIRSRQQQAATLQINTLTEHIRFRYMHMNPASLDADGVLNGRIVAEGEKIGVVSNYLDHPNGTSRHLHFDVQVFTRDGWIWVNPYITLVSAYERLIRGRGREIGPLIAASPIAARTQVDDAIRPGPQEGGEN